MSFPTKFGYLLERIQKLAADGDPDARLAAQIWGRIQTAQSVGDPSIIFGVASILSNRTKQGMVELILGDQATQLTLDKAREIRTLIDGAIEAAVTDEIVFRFLTERVGMGQETATRALADLREMRQGSKERVFPQ